MRTMNMIMQGMELYNNQKYDLPSWMREERLDNCKGFISDYYHDMCSGKTGRYR